MKINIEKIIEDIEKNPYIKTTIVKEFKYEDYNCMIKEIKIPRIEAYYTVYVEILESHILYKKDLCFDDEYLFNVNGGITFDGCMKTKDDWWVGYDYAHFYNLKLYDGTPPTLEEVEEDLKDFVKQIKGVK